MTTTQKLQPGEDGPEAQEPVIFPESAETQPAAGAVIQDVRETTSREVDRNATEPTEPLVASIRSGLDQITREIDQLDESSSSNARELHAYFHHLQERAKFLLQAEVHVKSSPTIGSGASIRYFLELDESVRWVHFSDKSTLRFHANVHNRLGAGLEQDLFSKMQSLSKQLFDLQAILYRYLQANFPEEAAKLNDISRQRRRGR